MRANTIDLAIIIPTLNEELYIGKLLDSIISQTVKPREIVIVDAYSKDKTIQEIKKRQSKLSQLKYFQIKRSTVSRQRNLGTKKTSSSHLLFLDADMEFTKKDALEKYFKEVSHKKPDVACAENLPDSNFWKDLIYFKLEDLLLKLSKILWPLLWPVITARNLYTRRNIFDKVGGFDEGIAVAEDQDLVQRILKSGGKLIFLKTVSLATSTRRVSKEGRRKYALRRLFFGIKIFLYGYKKAGIEYEFGEFKQSKST